MKTRKVPMRTCVACQAKRPKRELVRVVRTPEHTLVLDHKGKVSGRGAYVCGTRACVEQAIKTKRLDRALEVALTEEMVQALLRDLEGAEGDGGMA
jgi:predicted RNA-binding protein YlxR (DUF448 family)